MDSDRENELTREVVRIYQRYAQEVVERFGFCPWAERSRRDGQALAEVILGKDPRDFAESLERIDALVGRPELSVGLLIYPRFGGSRLDFEHFVRQLRHADSQRYAPGQIPFAMAAFHPDAEPALADAGRLVPFIRRSPDPTIQLVRCEALEAVRKEAENPRGTAFAEVWMVSPAGLANGVAPGIGERIAENNLKTVRRVGADVIEAVLADIVQDRDTSYRRFGLTPRGRGRGL